MLKFDLDHTIQILERTPKLTKQWLSGLSDEWIGCRKSPNTWCAHEVISHLIYGEITDWIPRTKIILYKENGTFEPFDHIVQFKNSVGKTMDNLLSEFESLRLQNIAELKMLPILENLEKTALHPALGTVNLQQLLSSWVVHDLSHIDQISRTMAYQYIEEVGPWKGYLGVLNR